MMDGKCCNGNPTASLLMDCLNKLGRSGCVCLRGIEYMGIRGQMDFNKVSLKMPDMEDLRWRCRCGLTFLGFELPGS